MKKILLLVSAVAALMLAGSCQRESLELVGDGKVTIAVETPGAIGTKSTIADGENVNELHYAIYKTDSKEQHAVGVDGSTPLAQGIVPISGKTTTVTFDLLQDQYYTVIFWAQVKNGNHYELGDLRMIKIKDNAVEVNGNDESRAAFFAKYEFDTEQPKDHKVTLRRPFSQLNLLTTVESLSPVQPGQTFGYTVDVKKSEVVVTGLSTAFNTVTGIGVAPADPTAEFKYVMYDTPAKQGQTTLKVNEVDYHYVSMNYLFVPVDGKENPDEAALVGVSYTIDTDNGPISNSLVNVPVKENYRTNVIGNLLTKETAFIIIVDEKFDEPALPDKKADELTIAAQVGGTVVLDADLALASTLTVNEGVHLTIDLNGYTLSTVSGNVILNKGVLTVKNGTVTSANIYGIKNAGTLTVNNVKVNAINNTGVMTFNSGAIENTISGMHAIYNAGTKVVIKDGTFSTTSGNELINNNAKSEVIIDGGTFTQLGKSYLFGPQDGAITINAGTFNAYDNLNGTNDGIRPGAAVIKGGTFNFDPTAYKAENTVVKANANGTYSVIPAVEGADEMVLHEASGLFYNGNTAAHKSVYYLMNASDLKKAAEYFENNSKSSEGNFVNFELMSDIDLAGTVWNSWDVMWINFNGNGHTISNITTAEYRNTGLFGYLGACTVKNLTLKNVVSNGAQAGVLAGRVEGTTTEDIRIAGINQVNYVPYSGETYNGVGAVVGVVVKGNINAEISEGAVVEINENALVSEAAFRNYLSGYLNENNGNIINKGSVKVIASSPIVAQSKGENYSGELFEDALNDAFVLQGATLKDNANITVKRTYDTVVLENVVADVKGDLITSEADNTIVLHDCEFTLEEGKKLIVTTNEVTVGQVMIHNVKVNGVLLTQASAAAYLQGVNWYEVW